MVTKDEIKKGIEKFHKSSSNQWRDREEALKPKIDQYLRENPDGEIPKQPLATAHKKIRKRMVELDALVSKYKNASNSKDRKNYRQARDDAQEYSDANFVVSKISGCFTNSPTESSSEESGEESGGEEYMSNGPEDAKMEEQMKSLERLRDKAARVAHDNWAGDPERLKKAVEIAHTLHRDYLRLAWRPGRNASPTPIPRKEIDKTSPPEFKKKVEQLRQAQRKVEDLQSKMIDDQKLSAAQQQLNTLKDDMWEWSNENLSTPLMDSTDYTHYRFIDDGKPEPDREGTNECSVLTVSQMNRLQKDLKALAVATVAGRGRRTFAQPSPPSSSGEVVPYLTSTSEAVLEVAAYRGHFLAVPVAPGSYKLLAMSEQFIWTPEALSANPDIVNAGERGNRKLHRCKDLAQDDKMNLLNAYKGIVGVAHRGYRTLNVLRAKKNKQRIGDCMVLVRWEKDGDTWETRTDFRTFRGATCADYEIYAFAKAHDTDEIAIPSPIPNHRRLITSGTSNLKKRSIRDKRWANEWYSDSEGSDSSDSGDESE